MKNITHTCDHCQAILELDPPTDDRSNINRGRDPQPKDAWIVGWHFTSYADNLQGVTVARTKGGHGKAHEQVWCRSCMDKVIPGWAEPNPDPAPTPETYGKQLEDLIREIAYEEAEEARDNS